MVEVYGADWCGDTQRTRRHLDSLGIAYQYINVERDQQAAAWVKQQNDGKERKPTVKIGKQVLAEPSNQSWSRRYDKRDFFPKGSSRAGDG